MVVPSVMAKFWQICVLQIGWWDMPCHRILQSALQGVFDAAKMQPIT